MRNLARLLIRVTVGAFVAAHGSQKLFGWFKGPGLVGTQGFMESLGMRPGRVWGTVSALGEFSGGVLTLLGFLNPVGPLSVAATMYVATRKAHWKLPLWTSQGGAELALTNGTAAVALALVGPGRYSLDALLGLRLPRPVRAVTWVVIAAVTALAVRRPELAGKALDVAEEILPAAHPDAAQSDLAVETRPVAPQQAAESEAAISSTSEQSAK